MIVDEGSRPFFPTPWLVLKHLQGGYAERFGSTFAVPAIAEKGYLDTSVEVPS